MNTAFRLDINPAGNIFKDRLLQKDVSFYRALNDSFMIINNALLLNQKDSKKGIELAINYLSKDNKLYDFISIAETLLDYIDMLTLDQGRRTGRRFIELGNNLLKIGNDNRLDYSALQEYIQLTLESKNCKNQSCSINPHFDEIPTIIHYLNQENDQGKKHLEILLETLAIKDKEDLLTMLEEFLPNLTIK